MIASDPPRVMYAAPDLGMGHWRNVCLVVWRANPTLESAHAMRERYVALARQFTQGFFALGVIERNVPNPDEPVRKAITAAMNAVEKELLGAAVVLEATGFAAAALRATLTTMSMLTRSRFPRHFFSSVDDAVAWTARVMPELGGACVIATKFAEFRAQIRS